MGILQNCKLYWGGYDLSGDSNRIEFSDESEMKDDTVFGDGALSRAKGLHNVLLNAQGFLNLGATGLETALMSDLTVENILVSFAPLTGVKGEVGYFSLLNQASFKTGGNVGDMLPYQVNCQGRGFPLLRGMILHNQIQTLTGNGMAYQVGAVLTGQKLYAGLHVYGIEGAAPTLDVVLQSDIVEAFSDPTARITFTQKTAIGFQWATPVAGPIVDVAEADDWWRVNFTLGGTITSATFMVVIAIL